MNLYFQPPQQLILRNQQYTLLGSEQQRSRCGQMTIYKSLSDQQICMKFSNPNKAENFQRYQGFLKNEIQMLQTIQGPNIVQFIDYQHVKFSESTKALCLFFKYYPHGSLAGLLYKYQAQMLNPTTVVKVLTNLYQGMNQLWQRGYSHGDMKFDNVLVDSNSSSSDINQILTDGRILIADFESVKPSGSQKCLYTKYYNDDNSSVMSPQQDIYTIGRIIQHSLCNKTNNTQFNQSLQKLSTNCINGLNPQQLQIQISNIHEGQQDVSYNQSQERFNENVQRVKGTELIIKTTKCKLCDNIIKSKDMVKHMETHKPRCKMQDCKHADIVYKDTLELQNHMEDQHQCAICEIQTDRMADHYIKTHKTCLMCDGSNLSQNHKYQCYFCKICNNELFENIDIKTHYKKKHNKIICIKCLNLYDNNDDYKDHLSKCGIQLNTKNKQQPSTTVNEKQSIIKQYKCRHCQQQFDVQKDLYIHEKKNHQQPTTTNKVSSQNVKCPQCGLMCANQHGLQTHIGKMHQQNQSITQIFKCNQCVYSSDTQHGLQTHIGRMHPIGRQSTTQTFKCNQCLYVSDTQHGLQTHIGKMHQSKQSTTQTFKCNQCDQTLNSQHGLQTHIGIMHPIGRQSTTQTFKCNQCVYSSDTQHGLQTHIGRMHPTQFKCNQCLYSSDTQHGLQTHIGKMHTVKQQYTIPVFKCPQCDYSSDTQHGLQIHIGRMHMQRKQLAHICSKCKQSFETQHGLSTHIGRMHK